MVKVGICKELEMKMPIKYILHTDTFGDNYCDYRYDKEILECWKT